MKYPKTLSVRGHVICVDEKVYEPAEDTFLLVENLKVGQEDVVLDMGTGCGILAVLVAEKAKKVLATDINPYAIDCAKKNAKRNCVRDKIEFRLGDLFQPIRSNEIFNLILFNAPYLPSEPYEEKSWIGRAWSGGPNGRGVIDRFVDESPEFLTAEGQILLVQSSLSNIGKTLERFNETGLEARVIAQAIYPFEKIALIEARSPSRF